MPLSFKLALKISPSGTDPGSSFGLLAQLPEDAAPHTMASSMKDADVLVIDDPEDVERVLRAGEKYQVIQLVWSPRIPERSDLLPEFGHRFGVMRLPSCEHMGGDEELKGFLGALAGWLKPQE